MLRFSLGVTRLDRIRNEYIRGTAHVGRLGDKVREARLRWFGHVQRRDTTFVITYLFSVSSKVINVGCYAYSKMKEFLITSDCERISISLLEAGVLNPCLD
ncbi:hypothetical protein QTP70_002667 [Hemibagrus guttatus]|uniref:Uncharacterized protein n=1 Tax=Hemibagrus guttatus TaxID=175788 RepID=A0AAE0QGK1_9TELE|nr:hypothetical protein QTP70_002667 [Hemibagrus guttatus]